MSNFKKMRIVDDGNAVGKNYSAFTTSPTIQVLGDLDSEIKNILESNISESEKARLYSQTLRRFLLFKQKYETEENIKRQKEIELLTKKINVTQPQRKAKKKVAQPQHSNKTPRQKIPSSKRKSSKKKQKNPTTTVTPSYLTGSTSGNQGKTLYDQFLEEEPEESWDVYLRKTLFN